MYFSGEYLLEVSPVVMNYKMGIGQWLIVLRGQTTFSIIICGGRKTEKHSLDMRGYVQG